MSQPPLPPWTTERLLVREFTAADAVHMQAFALEPWFWRHTSYDIRTAHALADFVESCLGEQQETPRATFNLAVNQRSDGAMTGFVKLAVTDAASGHAMLGYAFGQAYSGQGYAAEAAGTLLPFAFSTLGLRRLTADCNAINPASARVLDKLGFTPEGRLRQHRQVDGQWTDVLLYGLLASDLRRIPPG